LTSFLVNFKGKFFNRIFKLPVNTKYIAPFAENNFFHIIAKASGHSLLFNSDENKRFFLRKYLSYSSHYFDTYSYILMDNHVHWLVKCNSHSELIKHLSGMQAENLKTHQKKFIKGEITFEEALEFQCKDFFISYAMAYNKENNRQGALFLNPFRRLRLIKKLILRN